MPAVSVAASPATGIGLGLRRPHFDDILTSPRQPAWVEVLPENHILYGGRPRVVLDEVRRRMPVISHGVSLNIGGLDPLNPRYLDDLARFAERWQPDWFTDHLCFSAAFGHEYQDLVPVPFSERLVDHIAERVRRVRAHVGLPFGLENASYYLNLPGGTLGEGAMLRRVLEAADCGLLLDVNNVYVNAMNHGYDPWAFITALPLERVMQIHLAGHAVLADGMRFDTHGAPVPDPVWDLYSRLIARIGDVPTLIEWDNDIPTWDVLMDEVDRAATVRDAALLRRDTEDEPAEHLVPTPEIRMDTRPYSAPRAAMDPSRALTLVARAIDGAASLDASAAALGLSPHETGRLGFYRDLVAGHGSRILRIMYGDTLAALGEDRFVAYGAAYNTAHPMRDYDWNATAAAFPSFLAEREAPAWAVELARFEWAWFATSSHLAEQPDPAGPLAINPTLSYLSFTHQVVAFVQTASAARPPQPAAGEETVLLLRHPETQGVRAVPATPRALLALKIVAEGLTADALADAGADRALHAQALAEGHASGALVGTPPPPEPRPRWRSHAAPKRRERKR